MVFDMGEYRSGYICARCDAATLNFFMRRPHGAVMKRRIHCPTRCEHCMLAGFAKSKLECATRAGGLASVDVKYAVYDIFITVDDYRMVCEAISKCSASHDGGRKGLVITSIAAALAVSMKENKKAIAHLVAGNEWVWRAPRSHRIHQFEDGYGVSLYARLKRKLTPSCLLDKFRCLDYEVFETNWTDPTETAPECSEKPYYRNKSFAECFACFGSEDEDVETEDPWRPKSCSFYGEGYVVHEDALRTQVGKAPFSCMEVVPFHPERLDRAIAKGYHPDTIVFSNWFAVRAGFNVPIPKAYRHPDLPEHLHVLKGLHMAETGLICIKLNIVGRFDLMEAALLLDHDSIDEDSAHANAAQIKALGRNGGVVYNTSAKLDSVYTPLRGQIGLHVIMCKFLNPTSTYRDAQGEEHHLLHALMKFEGKLLAEFAPYDYVWGISEERYPNGFDHVISHPISGTFPGATLTDMDEARGFFFAKAHKSTEGILDEVKRAKMGEKIVYAENAATSSHCWTRIVDGKPREAKSLLGNLLTVVQGLVSTAMEDEHACISPFTKIDPNRLTVHGHLSDEDVRKFFGWLSAVDLSLTVITQASAPLPLNQRTVIERRNLLRQLEKNKVFVVPARGLKPMWGRVPTPLETTTPAPLTENTSTAYLVLVVLDGAGRFLIEGGSLLELLNIQAREGDHKQQLADVLFGSTGASCRLDDMSLTHTTVVAGKAGPAQWTHMRVHFYCISVYELESGFTPTPCSHQLRFVGPAEVLQDCRFGFFIRHLTTQSPCAPKGIFDSRCVPRNEHYTTVDCYCVPHRFGTTNIHVHYHLLRLPCCTRKARLAAGLGHPNETVELNASIASMPVGAEYNSAVQLAKSPKAGLTCYMRKPALECSVQEHARRCGGATRIIDMTELPECHHHHLGLVVAKTFPRNVSWYTAQALRTLKPKAVVRWEKFGAINVRPRAGVAIRAVQALRLQHHADIPEIIVFDRQLSNLQVAQVATSVPPPGLFIAKPANDPNSTLADWLRGRPVAAAESIDLTPSAPAEELLEPTLPPPAQAAPERDPTASSSGIGHTVLSTSADPDWSIDLTPSAPPAPKSTAQIQTKITAAVVKPEKKGKGKETKKTQVEKREKNTGKGQAKENSATQPKSGEPVTTRRSLPDETWKPSLDGTQAFAHGIAAALLQPTPPPQNRRAPTQQYGLPSGWLDVSTRSGPSAAARSSSH